MLSEIGSVTSSCSAGTGQYIAALQAQLDRYQQQLSDCINCSTAKTLQGQEVIHTLSNKIGEIKAHIEQITATKSNTQQATLNASATTGIKTISGVPVAEIKDNTAASSATAWGSVAATVGSILNVLA